MSCRSLSLSRRQRCRGCGVAESTVSGVNEQSSQISVGADHEAQRRVHTALPLRLLALWLLLSAAILGFIALGSVRIGAGNWTGQRMRISRIWANFLEYLGQQGASPLVTGVVVALAIVSVLGGCCLIWSAMAVRDEPVQTVPEDATPR